MYKYLTNFKNFISSYGKVTKGTQTSHDYRVGDCVVVDDINENHAGKEGVIVVPTDMKEKNTDMVKVEFKDGKSDYISIYQLKKI
jgi:hypothetical protein